jgi:ATP-binding protein involved in chromosome partitioning
MSDDLKAAILDKLHSVKGPELKADIVSLGLVSDVLVKDGRATFAISVPADRAARLEPLRLAAEKMALEVPGISQAMAVLTADTAAPAPVRPAPRPQDAASVPPPMQARVQQTVQPQASPIPGAIIAVASGKGGVGKSTTAVNLALGLQANGLKVGLMDADIYGPSAPRLLRITGRPTTIGDGRTLRPLEGYGLKVMSMGFLVDEDTAMIWRGPMVMSAITQMLKDVAWGDLDVLVVDMPPGTGDAQLTLAQQVPLAGAVIVSTPQDLALLDARKGIGMFRRVDVPILGIVENMSLYVCPRCGARHDIFGHGGAAAEAERIGVPFLGEVPLHIDIRSHSDAGTPVVVSAPNGPYARVYLDIAARIAARLEQESRMSGRQPPRIVIE